MANKLIGYARVSTRDQDTERQEIDLLAAGVRRDDLYVDRGVSGARKARPQLDQAIAALEDGDSLVVTTLDRLGRSALNMLSLAGELRARGVALRVLNLGGASVDTNSAMGQMMLTVMAAIAQMELAVKRERAQDSIEKRRAAGKDLGGRPTTFSDSQMRNAVRLVQSGVPAAEVYRDLGISKATYYRRISSLSVD